MNPGVSATTQGWERRPRVDSKKGVSMQANQKRSYLKKKEFYSVWFVELPISIMTGFLILIFINFATIILSPNPLS